MTVAEACAAAVVAHLGYLPAKGEVVVVPQSIAQTYTLVERAKAKGCAALLHIKWRIDKDR
jgi:hypothetical protein